MSQGVFAALLMALALVYVACFIVGAPSWNDSAWLIASAYLAISLLVLSAVDMRTYRLPDLITLPLILFGLAWHLFRGDPMLNYALGAAIGYGFVYALSVYWRHRRGAEGIGLGDGKLLGGAGAMVGATHLPFVLLIGSSTALLIHGGSLLLRKSKRSDYVAFGPYLAFGLWAVWCFARDYR